MQLERSVNRTMMLAGTRPLPGPFPEVGKLIFTKLDLRFDSSDEEVKVVTIETAVSPTKSVILTIPQDKVKGVFVVKDKDLLEKLDGTWHLGPDVRRLSGEMWGIAYVEKSANAVVNVEYSCCLDEFDAAAETEIDMMSGPLAFGSPTTC